MFLYVRVCVKSAPCSLCADVEVVSVARQRICFYHDWLSQPLLDQVRENGHHSSQVADLVYLHTLVVEPADAGHGAGSVSIH